MTVRSNGVSVLVASFNAEATIQTAIRSALRDPGTLEVLVIDDASTDATAKLVEEEARSDARVRLFRQSANAGPGAARNRGIDEARGSHIAVLDSDDFFLPDRLHLLGDTHKCELIADNIIFTNPEQVDTVCSRDWTSTAPDFTPCELSSFVTGNLKDQGPARGELGFLKPVMSLTFLNTHGLRYDETMRLGEDYDLYVRMMLAGGRMKTTLRPGYGAVVRSGSLSAQHSTHDLGLFAEALARHLDAPDIPKPALKPMRQHLHEVRARWAHRRFLDLRREIGNAAAIRYAAHPSRFSAISGGIARDKLGFTAHAGAALPECGYRLLLDPSTED
ncbi:Putative glycosyltransferase EpsH [Rhodobacteraceae bacterium THAF1]|uniref:glycosyltransferase family 2 protein n=1 Tax=Palleronia sp. THAF1 TaxID=2587842 RepID=UPI000F409FD1|nr:glycosyltransferase [Palleronia sp. THAF1]QFU10364.1 Putative glycosyltransferase EpsH [Palleronia sp. THAF1]VDC31483.1 Putative glycosyltransferase EpsH [Rhodobacteraceae bacterium THAF1]